MSLENFIENCRAAGLFESEESFSIDSLAAFRKVLASTLPETHYYLFQTLQALIKAEAQEIKVAVGRRENRISFQDPQRFFANLDILAGHFQKGLSVASNTPLDLLMSGLVTSLGAHMERAEIHCAHQRLVLEIRGLRQERTARPTTTPYVLFRRAQEKGMMASWSRVWGARKEEFRIRKAFEYSVIPLSIAGLYTSPKATWRRLLEGEDRYALLEVAVLSPHAPNHRGEHRARPEEIPGHPGFHLGEAPEVDPEGQALAIAPSLLMLALNSAEEPVTEVVSTDMWERRRWTFCFTNADNLEAEVQFVRNGFTIAHRHIDFGVRGLMIVAPADHLEVDATGYALVQNSRYDKTLEEARRLLKKIQGAVSRDALRQGLIAQGRPGDRLPAQFEWLAAPNGS